MQACLYQVGKCSKAYYQSTYPEPLSKSVISNIMVKNVEGMRQKNIPFLFMVGELPTYVPIVELKSENSVKFEDIVPVLSINNCHLYISSIKDFIDVTFLMCLCQLV